MSPVWFLLLLAAADVFGEKATFKGHRVIRTVPKDRNQLSLLTSLVDSEDLELDFWSLPSHVGANVDIRVSPENYPRLAKLLNANGLVFMILVPDLQVNMDHENPTTRTGFAGFDYGRYNTYDQIVAELKNLAALNSNKAQLLNFGKTYEGRPMYAMKITGSGQGKKTFFINCGIHAREWVTQATCMYMIKQMVSSSDASVKAMLDKMDWVIMPVLNVDGYVYTHTSYRMWRKTRSRNQGSSCMGTDPNRNWNYKWGGVGTSSSPCRDTYHGPRPFSEIEVVNVARYLYRNRRNLVGYMDIHAYSQLWMTPWGFTKANPRDYSEMKRVGDKAVVALYNAGYRTSYKVGSSSNIIYENSGGTKDWTYGVLGIKYSYALELRDKGRYGFNLPANQIIPTGLETFAAIKEMARQMKI